jgi:epoxyqueuosine reductase
MAPLPTSQLYEAAFEAGFDLVGFGLATISPEAQENLETWLEKGCHGEMAWLQRNRKVLKDPNQFLPGAKTVLSLAMNYGRPAPMLDGAQIARYAAGRDYHRVFKQRMKGLMGLLYKLGFKREDFRSGVDAVPLLERSLAQGSGIGFLAKSTGIIHPFKGPWLLLGEILLQGEAEPSLPPPGSCGTCTACIDACPTSALTGPGELDARLCLSYTTIELRGPIPPHLRKPQGQWLFGCDICIEVCPFAQRNEANLEDPDLRTHPALQTYDLLMVLECSKEDWDRNWTGTSIRRAQRGGIRRNAAIVLGNLGREDAAQSLEQALEDPDAGLRTAAAYALGKMGLKRNSIEKALKKEQNPRIQRDLLGSLKTQSG